MCTAMSDYDSYTHIARDMDMPISPPGVAFKVFTSCCRAETSDSFLSISAWAVDPKGRGVHLLGMFVAPEWNDSCFWRPVRVCRILISSFFRKYLGKL